MHFLNSLIFININLFDFLDFVCFRLRIFCLGLHRGCVMLMGFILTRFRYRIVVNKVCFYSYYIKHVNLLGIWVGMVQYWNCFTSNIHGYLFF